MTEKSRKPLQLAIFVVAAFYVYRHLALLLFRGGRRGDLDILLLAGQRFWNGEPVYLLSDDSEHTKPPFLNPIFALLSRLPSGVVHAAWDLLMLALPFLVLHGWNQLEGRKTRMLPLAGALALLGPLWFSEAGYGQYNLLLLLMTFVAFLWNARDSIPANLGAGALFWGSVVLKPTQLIFFPLFAFQSEGFLRRPALVKMLRFGAGMGAAAVANILLYLAFRSFPTLVSDLGEWARFIGESQGKHLLRADNFGLPTQLARWGASFAQSPAITLAGLLLATIAALRIRDLGQRFNTVIVIALVFSPMSWRQNYVMMLPLAYELIRCLEIRSGSRAAWTGVFALAVLARFNEYWLGSEGDRWWGLCSGPVLAALLALLARGFTLSENASPSLRSSNSSPHAGSPVPRS